MGHTFLVMSSPDPLWGPLLPELIKFILPHSVLLQVRLELVSAIDFRVGDCVHTRPSELAISIHMFLTFSPPTSPTAPPPPLANLESYIHIKICSPRLLLICWSLGFCVIIAGVKESKLRNINMSHCFWKTILAYIGSSHK